MKSSGLLNSHFLERFLHPLNQQRRIIHSRSLIKENAIADRSKPHFVIAQTLESFHHGVRVFLS